MTNERAKELFVKTRIEYECEPDWIIEGQKPDFFCTRNKEFWCEVKTLGPPKEDELLFDAHDELRKRAAKIALPGRGIAYVKGNLDHRDAKIVMSLLKRGLSRFRDTDSPVRVVALIPNKPKYDEFVRFSISTEEYSRVELNSCVSVSGKYEHPHEILPDPYSQMTRLEFSSGVVQDILACEILAMSDKYRVAIVAWPDEKPFDFLMTGPNDMAKKSRTTDRVRDAVAEANSQFKNAIRYKSAPCLLALFHDALDVPEEIIITSALYGDLKYAFSLDRSKEGKLFIESNGAWNPNKNRTTSAVMYVRNGSQPLVVHNCWAERPFPRGVFNCKEIIALDDGSFKELGV